jgi:hypothetical protein
MYACSPRWNADWMSEHDLARVMEQVAGSIMASPYGRDRVDLSHGLHITGGEPFLNFQLLLRSVELAREFNIPSRFVETNSYWCTDDDLTRERLRELKDKGLNGIMISINPFYLEYVPFERTQRALRVAQEVFPGNVMLYQYEYYRQFEQMGIRGTLPLNQYMKHVHPEEMRRSVELFLIGRASESLVSIYPKYPAHTFFDTGCQPPFIRDWHNHIDNYCNYVPGFCGGISLGDARNMEALCQKGIDLAQHPVLRFLVSEDMAGLLTFAQREYDYVEREHGYISRCHLCLDIRKHLVSNGDFDELQPEEFYQRL